MLKKLPVLDIEDPPLADPGQWAIKVDGFVDNPVAFSIQEIKEMDGTDAMLPIICVEGRDMWAGWKGVRLSDVIRRVSQKQDAKRPTFYSYSEYTDSLSIENAMYDRTMRVYGLDGGDLPADNGGPLRQVVPFKLACKSVKRVTRIAFVDSEEPGYHEVCGYPADAGIPDDKMGAYGL